jgi:ectoine hydroxylase-related dioxygenase (phytanoyl-CoA dioxygenase family)
MIDQPAVSDFAAAKQHFDREGYAIFRQVIDADLLQEVNAHLDWLHAKYPQLRPENYNHELVRTDPFWVHLISNEGLLDVAQQFIGPDIGLFASHYISKPPFDGQAVLWHQDGSYWPLDPMEVVTLWLSVDHSDPENGCMRVIPRTQTLDLQELETRTDVPNVLESAIKEGVVDESQAVDIILNPGDVSVHHPNIIHGSNANTSPRRRAGLTIRYIPTTTRIVTKKLWPSAFHLRGQVHPEVNQYNPVPEYKEGEHMPFRGAVKNSVRPTGAGN